MTTRTYSQKVTRQLREAEELLQACQTHSPKILDRIHELLEPPNTGSSPDGYQLALASTMDHLSGLCSELNKTDLEHSSRILQSRSARTQRDDHIASLVKELSAYRLVLQHVYGDDLVRLLGMTGETPRAPKTLARWLANVLNIMDGLNAWPKPVMPYLKGPVREELLAHLQLQLEQLHTWIEQVELHKQMEKDTLTRKHQLIKAQRDAFLALLSLSQAYTRLAGLPALRTRLR